MKEITLLAIATLISVTVFAQDKIVRKDHSKIFCSISTIDSDKIYFTTEKNGKNRATYILKNDVIKYKKDGEVIYIDNSKNKKKAKTTPPLEPSQTKDKKDKIII